MKKLLIVLCICFLQILLLSCGSSTPDKPNVTADYDSVHDAAMAQRDGVNIVGKTVKVEVAEIQVPDPELNILWLQDRI